MKYFTDEELRSPDTLEYVLARGFAERLDTLRELYGKPMVITSAARSKEYNKSIGGHPKSLHVYDEPYHPTGGCAAVDVSIRDSADRYNFIQCAQRMKFSVGINKTFIHIDDRSRLLGFAPRAFLY